MVDEAYFEYVRRDDFPDALGWVSRRPGTAVLRTFSKIYGLAGLRIGYGVMDPELAGYLERARHPFNVNLLSEVAALAALDDDRARGADPAPEPRGSGSPQPRARGPGDRGLADRREFPARQDRSRELRAAAPRGRDRAPDGWLRAPRARADHHRDAQGEREAGQGAPEDPGGNR